MDQEDYTESAADIVAAARALEPGFTHTRLRRWCRRGKIDCPFQARRPGYRTGTIALYPSGTTELVLDLIRESAVRRATPDEAWRAWWAGSESCDFAPIRHRLTRVGRELADAVETLSRVDGDPVAAAALTDATKFATSAGDYRRNRFPREPWLRRARKRVTAALFAKVIQLMLRVGRGQFSGFVNADERCCYELSMGLDRARVDRLHDAGPWLNTDMSRDLRHLAELIQSTRWDRLVPTQPAREEMERYRDEAKAIGCLLSEATRYLESIFGQWAFGFKLFAAAFQPNDPERQATMILLWKVLRELAEDGAIERLLATAEHWQKVTTPALEALELIRLEIPAFGAVLSPASRRRAFKSAESIQRHYAELSRLRESHLAEVDAFWSRHPELRPTQGVAPEGEKDSGRAMLKS